MATDPPSWDIPDLDEPSVRPPRNGTDRSGAACRDDPNPALDDDDLFGHGAEALQLELGSTPAPAEPPPTQPNASAPAVEETSPTPADLGVPPPFADAQAKSGPPAETEAVVPTEVREPRPGFRITLERRLDSWADRILPDPVRDRFGDGGLIELFSGTLLIVGSVTASVGSCSYLAATGERVDTGWLAGLLLVAGVGLIVHGWVRGGGS